MLTLIGKVESALFETFPRSKYKNVENYLHRWAKDEYDNFGNLVSGNFELCYADNHIDANRTLNEMPEEFVLRIAADLGVETPSILPGVVTEFKNILPPINRPASQAFQEAIKEIYESPHDAVLHATSALDGIVKSIMAHPDFEDVRPKNGEGLSKQVGSIVKKIKQSYSEECPKEVTALVSGLNSVGGCMDNLRSRKTLAHCSAKEDFLLDDPIYASLVINAVATIGTFLYDFFNKRLKLGVDLSTETNLVSESNDESESDLSQIPF